MQHTRKPPVSAKADRWPNSRIEGAVRKRRYACWCSTPHARRPSGAADWENGTQRGLFLHSDEHRCIRARISLHCVFSGLFGVLLLIRAPVSYP